MKGKGFIVHLAGVVAMILWGMSFVWSTQVYQNLNPTATICLRLVVATLFFTALFVYISPKRENQERTLEAVCPCSHV